MDPSPDPLSFSAQTGDIPAAAPVAAAANPNLAQPVAPNHPPYPEMISAAIVALNERDGSPKRAIAKYIEAHYPNLPPTHSVLLTHHLSRLKTSGQLVMVKHSYNLPSRSTVPSINGSINAVTADPASAGTKKRGRPPKPKSNAAAVPVFGSPINTNAESLVGAPPPENVAVWPGAAHIAVGPVNGPTGGPVRGPGRPPKRGRGRPPKSGAIPSVGRGRGRPKKNAMAPVVASAPTGGKGPGRPRGRPPKTVNVVEGLGPGGALGGGVPAVPVSVGVAYVGPPPVAGKRRGRPPKAGGVAKKPRKVSTVKPRRPRKLSGKPVGRPRKNALGNQTAESQLLVSYLRLKQKLDTLKDKVNEAAALIKPSLNSESAINALHELQMMVMNINAPPDSQNEQQQQQPLPLSAH